jgi:phosphonate transport system permease protein
MRLPVGAGSSSRWSAICWRCLAVAAVLTMAVVASFAALRMDYRGLFSLEAARAMGRFIGEFFPPDVSPPFLAKTAWAALQTVAVSGLGTLLAVLLGGFLAVPASGRAPVALRVASRMLLNILRSIPELVWAALWVLAAGLGPMAGALALAIHTTGVLGRLFAESLENAPLAPERALRESGVATGTAFIYGTLPIVLPQCLAYSLYRWEMNIRMAAVMGFVGAGGLGQMLYFHLSLFQQAQAATVLAAVFLVVVTVDIVSGTWRRRLG